MNKIKDARRRHGMTQNDLAKKIGVSEPVVSKWETERLLPNKAQAEALKKILGVTVENRGEE